MRLFSYYVLHTFKNSLRKLLKTWVLIFLAVCLAVGIGAGLLASFLEDSVEEPLPEDPAQSEIIGEPDIEDWEEESLFDVIGIDADDLIELIAGGIMLAVFVLFALSADKNGSKIFLPADVNLLFASPMKPQSVLMFRLTMQLGVAILGSAYMLFQIPNLVLNAGLSIWAALSLVAAWCFTIVIATLIQVLLYTLSSTYPAVKRFLRQGIYILLALIVACYLLFAVQSGEDFTKATALFFNSPYSRFVPFWGWLKGFCVFAIQGSIVGVSLCFAALVLGGGLLVYVIWHLKADFYEDAMAKSEETAELLARVQSEKSSGILIRRKKDRGDQLRRDGLRHGSGANVFFFKTMYNRFRFAHLGFLTKTMEFYLVAAVGVASVCRFVAHTDSVVPVALVLAAISFFRTLGNPLEQDTNMDYFVLIPESTWAKLFWSLMGGTVNCLLDVLPAVVVGALLVGANPLPALAWVPFIVSVDFYATNVGAFIGLSVPVSAGKTVKQIVQVMFIYFGLLPDIASIALGCAFDFAVIALIGAAALNIFLGLLFFGLSPIFLDPPGGRQKQAAAPFRGDLRAAKKQFSRLGLGAFAILAVATALQLAAASIMEAVYPDGNGPSWLLWVCTFAPMYLAAVPVGLLVMRKAPAAPREKHSLRAVQIVIAFIICVFVMYAGNLAGVLVTSLLQTAFGLTSANPLLAYVADDALWLRMLVMVILAPIIEEYVFRKQLIDRMNIYGEKLAVVTSALMFGLFHGNLSQLFYASALGLVFGYVYLKTGRLRYSAGLHMLINFLGGVLAPALLNGIDLAALDDADLADPAALTAIFSQLLPIVMYALGMIGLALAGLVLFCVKIRDVSFAPAALELPKGAKLKTACLNVGMILLFISCMASITLMFAV